MVTLTWQSPLERVTPELATPEHPVWQAIKPTANKPGFRPSEFKNPGQMDAHFLYWLYDVRQLAGVPFRVNSDARDPEADIGAQNSAHEKRPCRAVDLQAMNTYERARIVIAAARLGCVRIGVYPSDKAGKGGVHLDCETHPENPSPRMWTRY